MEKFRNIFSAFKNRKRNSLRKRLIVCMLLVTLLPVVLIDFIMYSRYLNIMQNNVEKLTTANLEQTKTALDVWIDSYGDIISQLYNNQDVKSNLQMYYEYGADENVLDAIDRELSALLYAKDYIMAITIITEEGDSFFHDRITPFSSHSFWINHYSMTMEQIYDMTVKNSDTTYFSTEYAKTIPARKYYLFHMAHELMYYCNGKESKAAVIVSIDEQLLENICNYDEGEVAESINFIVDANGYIVSYPESSYLSQKIDVAGLDEDAREEKYREFVFETGMMNNKDVKVQLIHDEQFDWDVINVSTQEAYSSEIARMQSFVISFAVVSGLLAIIAIVITIQHLVKNISHIVKKMARIEKGDTEVRIDLDKKMTWEIVTIADHLNRMLDKLQESMEKEKLLAERERVAEIAALEARINPHFLYNTLDTINWMAIDKNEIEISNAISALGKILRYGINDSNGIVTIKTELEWLEQYIYLQRTRLNDTFEFNVNVDPQVINYKIHKLLFQPFVENSIIHGFANRSGLHKLSVVIKETDMIEISVQDNGGGMKKEQVDMINSGQFRQYDDKYHIGMENAFQRIKLYYGEEAQVYVVSENGKNTTVCIKLPKEEVLT